MKTRLLNERDFDKIIKLLEMGEVVAIATETVYGLATIMGLEKKLYEVKERSANKPIAYLVDGIEMMEKYAKVPKQLRLALEQLIPCSITIVLEGFSDETIGFRLTKDAFLKKIVSAIGSPLMLTSANLSGSGDLVIYEDVVEEFNGKIGAIVKGECLEKVATTVVDATNLKEIKVLREGAIKEAYLKKVLIGKGI